MFHFMFVHYTFSSVWVAEWPPFGKGEPGGLMVNADSRSRGRGFEPNSGQTVLCT